MPKPSKNDLGSKERIATLLEKLFKKVDPAGFLLAKEEQAAFIAGYKSIFENKINAKEAAYKLPETEVSELNLQELQESKEKLKSIISGVKKGFSTVDPAGFLLAKEKQAALIEPFKNKLEEVERAIKIAEGKATLIKNPGWVEDACNTQQRLLVTKQQVIKEGPNNERSSLGHP